MDKTVSQSYLDHLDVLRRKIIYIILFAAAGAVLSFIFIDKLVALLISPASHLNIKLHFFKPQEKFLTYIKIAFFSGLAASVPFALIQLGNFIYPAMKQKERKYFYILLTGVGILFIAGCIFSFKIMAPFVFKFFISFSGNDGVLPVWGFADYYNLLILLIFMMGLVFLTPLLLLFLMRVGILKLKTNLFV